MDQPKATPQTPPTERGRILLAEDDPFFSEYFAERLRGLGHEVVCARDADEAIERLRAVRIDVLITDIYLPGNESLQLVETLRGVEPNLPVIVITGRPDLETAIKSVNCSVLGYLTKPPDWEAVERWVSLALRRHNLNRELTEARARVREWIDELQRVEGALQDDADPGRLESANRHLRHTAVRVLELLRRVEALPPGVPPRAGTPAESRERRLHEAIERAVEVLLQTRQNFKSKRLGELRASLSRLLSEREREKNDKACPPSTPPPPPLSPPP